ncbi:MAG: right-handed parallel beta-helix repeat-containing protein [Candidatus Hydrogenedentes bacterium]|nr:right-handed parallel beta-helix repeat-containing protein [Candidatus Hydrogenedentota bacterium]
MRSRSTFGFIAAALLCVLPLPAKVIYADERVIGPFPSEEPAAHQRLLQEVFDAAGPGEHEFHIAPGEYRFSDPKGVRIPGNCTVVMEGVRIVWEAEVKEDGQTFLLENVSRVALSGCEIIGRRDVWSPGTNIAGVRVLGDCHDIRISYLTCRDLTSNAVGFFGEESKPMSNVTLKEVRGYNCCNYYGDYLATPRGPAEGSKREDQGTVAMYFVNDWLVDACWFEGSQSDGTHFFHSHRGRFVNSVVRGSKMGGYFLEGCEDIVASGNHILENGSRGCTIERNSRCCTLANNIVKNSGREGLWAPDVEGIIVTGTIFKTNGRKNDADKDCEIRIDETSEYEVSTRDILIQGNMFYTTPEQTAVFYVSPGVAKLTIEGNGTNGDAPLMSASAAIIEN